MTRPNGSPASRLEIAMQQCYRGIRLSPPPHKLLATLQDVGLDYGSATEEILGRLTIAITRSTVWNR